MNKKKINTYLYGNVYPRWVILLIDSFIIVASLLFAFVARNGIENKFDYIEITKEVILVVSLNIFCLSLFRIPLRVLRYTSLFDLLKIAFVQTFCYFILSIFNQLAEINSGIPLIQSGIIPIAYFMSSVLLISLRIVVKTGFEFRSVGQRDSIRVMIYASENKGGDIVRRLRGDNTIRYRIKGFITDNVKMSGRYLMAIPVYMNDDKLLNVIDNRVIDAIVIDSVKMNFNKSTDFIDELLRRGIKLITLSLVEELKKETEDIQKPLPRNILIEDLLSIEPVRKRQDDLIPVYNGKRIMVTGAAGSIGRELVRQLSAFRPDMFILVDQAETPLHDLKLMLKDDFDGLVAHTIVADITNRSRIESIFNNFHPQFVFHLAAYKHIPMLESDISEAIQVNIMGTCILADLAAKYQVEEFVFASTDKVVYPDTIMGVSKKIAEQYVLSFAKTLEPAHSGHTKFIVTRFGNILDSNGSVLLRFKEQIARKENLVVTHPDAVRRFLTVEEVVGLVLKACSLGESKIVYTFDAGHPVKILDLAKRMISLSGYIPGKDIKIEYSGLRPGEKLSEVKLIKNYEPTGYNKIYIVPESVCHYDWVNKQVTKLVDESYKGNCAGMISVIKEIVPEFSMTECNCDKYLINNN